MGGPPPNDRIEDLFFSQAAATPDAAAIFFRGECVSYGRLREWVDRAALDLARHGVGPGVVVALCLTRTPAMIAMMLAILRSGGAYLPLDSAYPAERLGFILADSAASVLVTDSASSAWSDFRGTVLACEGEARLAQISYGAPPIQTGPPELAYVIYTSGSTGRPKGVMLGHGATCLVAWGRRAYSDQERSRVAATTSLCFDPSVLEIFVPLCAGGAVVLKQNALEPFAPGERPTMLGTVPSVLRELCRADAIPRSLEVLNVGGEALPRDLVREAYRSRPDLSIYNHYGPTEATTCVTVGRMPRDLAGDPPLGRPVRGARIVLLSPAGRAPPEGQLGEIHIGGPGLALGYLNRPDLTADRFVLIDGERLYRTGDLGFWRGKDLHFAGRMDRQVKIRGVRIEPAEIEAALMRDPRIEAALVVVRPRPSGLQLVAYVESPLKLTPAAVRQRLMTSLPAQMAPAHIVVMSAFPRLVSGKIDHAALPDPSVSAYAAEGASRAERPILHVFEEVLGRRPVRPEDSFFELGGDSLSSVRAALRLEEVLGHDLPAGLLRQAPTARALANALGRLRARPESHLSLLQPGGDAPPLFCLADLFGQPFNYLNLARRLAPDRPVYGLAPGPLQEAFTSDGDVGRLTRGFMAEVRRVQPQGPYLIAGYSAGGLLAVDLAAALEREGQAVRLVLLDSVLHARRPSGRAFLRWTLEQARSLMRPQKLATRIGGLAALLAPATRAFGLGRAPAWVPRSQLAFAGRMIKVGASYSPGPFGGPALMVVAQDRDPIDRLFDQDGLSGWSGVLRGDIHRAEAPGAHHAFMREPDVEATALAVRRFLNGAAEA
jgi:amino acid adenylation domain-containing protein